MSRLSRQLPSLVVLGVSLAAATVVAFNTPAYGQAAAGGAAASKPKQTFAPNDKVEVREGDEWSSVTIVKKEGRKYQIRYEDGEEEWVTPDRLRAAKGAGAGSAPAPAAGTPRTGAKPATAGRITRNGKTTGAPRKAPAKADEADEPAADDDDEAAAKPKKDTFAKGAKVEVKQAHSWNKATIKEKDGDLYLVAVDGWENKPFWNWVHAVAIRKIGSDKPGPKWGKGVQLNDKSVQEAKAEARAQFATIEQEVAAEQADGKGDPFAGAPYDKEIAEVNTDGADDLLPAAEAGKLATFDALEPKVKLAARPVALKKAGGTVLLGATRGLVIHTTGHGNDVRTVNVEVLDLVAGKNSGATPFDPLSNPIAISPSGARILGRSHGFFGNTRARVDLFAVAPGGGEPTHQISFKPFAGEKQADVEWAAFVDENHVLTCNSQGKLIMWDAPKATALWQMTIRQGAYPALSPNRKQLAVLTSGELVVVDPIKGDGICSIPGSRLASGLAFTPDGKRVVGSTGTTLVFWDLAEGKLAPDIGLPAKGAGAAGGVVPADGRFVLVGGRDLVDLDTKAVVWRYEGTVVQGAWGAPAVFAVGGRCWSVVSEGNKSILTSAALPHKSARAAAEKVQQGQMLLVKPGGSVSLSVTIEGPIDAQQRITAAITQQLGAHDIKVDPASPIRLVAKTENGKTESRTFQRGFGGGPFGGGGGEAVNVTEKICRITFEENGKIAWEAMQNSGYPNFVQQKDGQTIAQAVMEANKPNLMFLEQAQIPAFVPRATDTPWLGVSRWSMNGVTDDPAAPAFKPPAGEGDGLQ